MLQILLTLQHSSFTFFTKKLKLVHFRYDPTNLVDLVAVQKIISYFVNFLIQMYLAYIRLFRSKGLKKI